MALHVLQKLDFARVTVRNLDRRLAHRSTCSVHPQSNTVTVCCIWPSTLTWDDDVGVLRRVLAHFLLADRLPDLGQAHHAGRIHDSVAEGVRVVPADAVDGPVGGLEVGDMCAPAVPIDVTKMSDTLQTNELNSPDGQVLDVPPGELWVGLEAEGDDAGGKGRGGAGAGVRRGAQVVQVGGHHLAL